MTSSFMQNCNFSEPCFRLKDGTARFRPAKMEAELRLMKNYGTAFECRARKVSVDVRWRNCGRKMEIVVVGCAAWYSTVLYKYMYRYRRTRIQDPPLSRAAPLTSLPPAWAPGDAAGHTGSCSGRDRALLRSEVTERQFLRHRSTRKLWVGA